MLTNVNAGEDSRMSPRLVPGNGNGGIHKVSSASKLQQLAANEQPTKNLKESDLKKVRKVRFNPYVHRIMLPIEDAEDAQKSRKSRIKEAPYHDELWDGDTYSFRERELTSDELWALRLKTRMTSIPRKLRNPLKRGLRALQYFLPGSQGVDQISAHAHKLDEGGKDRADSSSPQMPMLSLNRQGSSGRAVEIYDEEITPATFARHAELVKMIEELKTCPEDLVQCELQLASHRKELQNAKDELRQLRFELPELERRLDRNANPRLLHYMQFARDEKVRKLQEDYDRMKQQKDAGQKRVEKLAMSIYEENERLDRIGTKLSQLRGAEAERKAIENFVIQEFGKEDAKMVELWDSLDACKSKLEKENMCEKRLKKAITAVSDTVINVQLQAAQQALQEAIDLTKVIARNGASSNSSPPFPSGRPVSSAPSLVKSRISYFGGAFSPSMSTNSGPSSSNSYLKSNGTMAHHLSLEQQQSGLRAQQEETMPATLRRKAFNRARENVVLAIDTLEKVLDELEESCAHMWTPSVLAWRREIPNVTLQEFFGSGILTKRISSDLDFKSRAAKESQDAEAETRIQRKLAVVQTLENLATRYLEYIQREASRTHSRKVELEDKKKVIECEVNLYGQIVFQSAKARLLKTTVVVSAPNGPPTPMDNQSVVNKVASGATELTSGELNGSQEHRNSQDDDDTSSMIFPVG